jgi:hypothetical protein
MTAQDGKYFTAVQGGLWPRLWAWQEADGVYALHTGGGSPRKLNGADLDAALRNECQPTAEYVWRQSALAPGQYYARVQREWPLWALASKDNPNFPDMLTLYEREAHSALRAADILFGRMKEVFRYIEPAPAASSSPSHSQERAYGHELRHLLILACTEVESNLKAVLTANGNQPNQGKRFTMEDYERLLSPMRLGEWKLGLAGYRDFRPLQPFANWPAKAPPPWWAAHNGVKHDRETKLQDATLGQAIDAAAAVYVSIAAQFGAACLHYDGGMPRAVPPFIAEDGPKWDPEQVYVPPRTVGIEQWTAVHLTV